MTLPSLMPPVDSSQLADAGSLAALKRAAAQGSPQALRQAARQFESLFVSMVLKSVRQANFKDPLFGSDQGNLYQDMYDDQIAAEISKGKGLGLADMLVQQLRRQTTAATGSSSGARSTTGTSKGEASMPGKLPGPRSGTTALRTESVAEPSGTVAAVTAAGAAPSGCPTSTQQASFARALWPDAQQAARQLGVSPVSLLAQAALETDWGRRMPRDASGATSHNLFGIKATPAWGGAAVESSTREYSGGAPTAVRAQFRAYASAGECFEDYVALLRGNPRYAAALGTGSDVQAFGSALQQGGYATDPAYASKLTAVAGTLERALAPQPGSLVGPGPAVPTPGSAGPLKIADGLPITAGSGALQRR